MCVCACVCTVYISWKYKYWNAALIVNPWSKSNLERWACVVSLHLEVMCGWVLDGIFQWWITLACWSYNTWRRMWPSQMTSIGSRSLTFAVNKTASGQLERCTISHFLHWIHLLKECFRCVRLVRLSGGQASIFTFISGCLTGKDDICFFHVSSFYSGR